MINNPGRWQPAHPSSALPLSHLTFYLTDGCNLACRHCAGVARRPANGRAHHYLPVDRIGSAVREALPLGLQTVRLSGGEPLQHPDLELLLDRLESLELAVEIETTGCGLTPLRAARLARLPRCSVMIGLNGSDAATHETVSRGQGDFDTASQAAALLSTAGLAPQIVTTLVRRNAGQIPGIIHLAETLGAESIRFALVNTHAGQPLPGGACQTTDCDPETLSVEELIALGRRVERDLSRTTHLQLLFEQPPAFRGLHPMARIVGQGRCGLLTSLGVLPTGEYGLCGIAERTPELTFGKVGEVPLAEIWHNHPTLRALRQGLPDRLSGICGRCMLKTACLGNCAAENYLETGAFWGPYWFCEAAQQAGLFPAGRIIENAW